MTVRCGRLDDHEPHAWTRPALATSSWSRPVPSANHTCHGAPVIEGGHGKYECDRCEVMHSRDHQPPAVDCDRSHCAETASDCRVCVSHARDEARN